MSTPNPTQDAIYVAMSSFLQASLGLSQNVVLQGLPNRTAMPPASPGYVTMELQTFRRLRTNQTTWDLIDPATALTIEQGTMLVMDLDFYGALAGDWAVIMCTLLRDEVGCVALAPACQPLYADDGFMIPLDDDELQYELRWHMEAVLQYNPVITAPMQFFETAEVELINVDATYPP